MPGSPSTTPRTATAPVAASRSSGRSWPTIATTTCSSRRRWAARCRRSPRTSHLDAYRGWVDASRRRLGVERLDLIQVHCPPTVVIESDRLYDDLDVLVAEGSIARYGVSVETADEALSAIARPHVASIQIVLNAFRLKPLDRVLPAAMDAGVAIIARVPLASGLLSGRYTRDTVFAADDHRTFNRHGEIVRRRRDVRGRRLRDRRGCRGRVRRARRRRRASPPRSRRSPGSRNCRA